MAKRRKVTAARLRLAGATLLLVVAAGYLIAQPPAAPPLVFPDGKSFAFTIVDDTDMATLARLRHIYAVLHRYGLRTTRTVWVYDSNQRDHPANDGDSLQDAAFRQFTTELQVQGFEIALHGVRGGSSRREDTLTGLELYRTILGGYPRMHINHSLNLDNLYWGPHLYAVAPLRWAARLAIPYQFAGHDPASEYFWGDVAQQRIDYVRRFTYSEINLRRVVPSMPYHLPEMPHVNFWFPTANGNRLVDFEALLSDDNLDRLEREGGVCFVYAHLGAGSFGSAEGADPRFEARIKAVAARNGWFAPASEILDFLRRQPSWTGRMSYAERIRLDLKFVAQRIGVN